MEPAKIDWKRVESVFVEDELYENINAPKWVDFLAPDDSVYVDDTTWFCRPDCNHPKTAEDFLKISTPVSSKVSSSGDKTRSPLGEWNFRDLKLKRRGQIQSSNDKSKLNDSENRNPNTSTPPPLHHSKSLKAMIKSNAEKNTLICDDMQQTKATSMRLKSTLSDKNLFAGKDILSHIAEFCNELKRMAIGSKEKDNSVKLNNNEIQVEEKKEEVMTANDDVNSKERKSLPEVGIEKKSEEIEKRSTKKKQTRKIRLDDEENIPFPLNLENVKSKGEDQQRLLQIRTNPPSPQCFNRAQAKNTTTPLKASKSRLMVPRPQQERGVLQEVKQQNKEENSHPDEKDRSISIVDGKEARTMDVFWFLKPCTATST